MIFVGDLWHLARGCVFQFFSHLHNLRNELEIFQWVFLRYFDTLQFENVLCTRKGILEGGPSRTNMMR